MSSDTNVIMGESLIASSRRSRVWLTVMPSDGALITDWISVVHVNPDRWQVDNNNSASP